MPKTRELSEFERGRIIGGHELGHSFAEIARKWNHDESTVRRIVQKYNEHRTVANLKGRGRKRLLNENDVRQLKRVVTNDRRAALAEITNTFNQCREVQTSSRTVQRTLHAEGYYGRIAKKKPLISEANRKKRLEFARNTKNYTGEWNNIIWSDESRFELFVNDSSKKVWRKPHEKFNKDCLSPTVKHAPGVMVWGCFTRSEVGPLVILEGSVTAKVYVELLEQHLLPFMRRLRNSALIFQDDNCRIHRARIVNTFKEENNISSLSWPAQSPDLNPIENLWAHLEKKVRERKNLPKNRNELFAALNEEWIKIDSEVLANLVDSMPRRVKEVIKAKGNPTRY